ncbi:MAG: hypothetical protein ACRCUY_02665 [Thermoguttaceae bacterium]
MIEKNSSRSIKAGKEVRSTALTVCFSHRGTEDTEKRQQILREPCASVREKNSSHSITAGKEVRRTVLTVYFRTEARRTQRGGNKSSVNTASP